MLKRYRDSFLKILRYFPTHWKEEAHWGYYVSLLVFLALSLYLNYNKLPEGAVSWLEGILGPESYEGVKYLFTQRNSTIERFIQRFYRQEILIFYYFLFYGLPYAVGVLLYAAWHKRWYIFRQPEFWIKATFGILVLSFDAAFYYQRELLVYFDDVPTRYFARKVLDNMGSILGVGLPLWIFKHAYDRHMESFYGLTWKQFDYRPYVILMALMVPLVVGASFTEGFSSYYPTLKHRIVSRLDSPPLWVVYTCYEIVYALDFIWTEVAFRGFLVIGLSRALGVGSVGPMAAVYCYRHFAKPFGESVSSIFGGYILGVIALHSRNVMGGVFVHMGIALLMELCAFLQWAIRGV